MNSSDIQYPAAKAASAWCAYGMAACFSDFGIKTWADASAAAQTIAGVLAGFYSLVLITEWFWKKFWRPLFISYGWVKARPLVMIKEQDDGDE